MKSTLPTKKPAISVVIPTFGREKVLVDTIKDVLKQKSKKFELVVIDQTVKHEVATTEFLTSINDSRFRYYTIAPPSLTAARNFALSVVRAPIVVFIDDDVILSDMFIQGHIDSYHNDVKVVAVAGRVIDLVHKWPKSNRPLYFDKYGMGHGSFNCEVSQPGESFPGGNMSFKTDFVKRLGGFDTRYDRTAIREESDMAMRIHRAGGKIHYSAEASLDHLAAPYGGTRIKVNPLDSIAFYSNELMFTLKFVPLRYLPIGMVKRLKHAMHGVGWKVCLKRFGLFVMGFVEALYKLLLKPKLIAYEIEVTS